MKVTTKTYVNIRSSSNREKSPTGVLNPNVEIEVVETIPDGEKVYENSTWYKDSVGNYYWSGGFINAPTIVPVTNVVTAPIVNSKQSFFWFRNLGIENIWNTYGAIGDNVTVAILDSGYDIENNDLSAGIIGVRALNTSEPLQEDDIKSELIADKLGHGTFCASIIGSRNLNQFNIGIAPKSKLLIGKLSDYGELDAYSGLDLIIDGIEWAINSGAEIISISYGKFGYQLPSNDDYLANIQNRLNVLMKDKKVLIFSLSGNNPPGEVIERENYPASFIGCVSVGASNNGELDGITSLSSKTIIHAQGIDVESYDLNNLTSKKSGTSMSTPIVAGVAALAVSYLKTKHGDWDPADLRGKIYSTGSSLKDQDTKRNINITNLFKNL